MICVTLAGDIVFVHAVVRQNADGPVILALAKLVHVERQRLAYSFDVVQYPYFLADKLPDPDGHRIRGGTTATKVKEGTQRQEWIRCNLANTAVSSCLRQASTEVCAFKCLGIVTLPDVVVPIRIKLQVTLALVLEDVAPPRIIAPIRLYDNGTVRLLDAEKLINGVRFAPAGSSCTRFLIPATRMVGRSSARERALSD